MRRRSKVKLSLIANKTLRRASFKKRKSGIMKKLNELVTICDVKACAVIYSPDDSNLEAWPSREGVREVFSRFMELPMLQRTENMVDLESYIWEKIRKEQDQVEKLHNENRQFELRETMFDCLKGKMMEYHFGDASDTQDLSFFIDRYVNALTRRIEILEENDAAAVTAHVGFGDHNHQYQNQQVGLQYQVPSNLYNHTGYQNMNQQEPIQYQTPANFYGQNQQRFYDMNSNQIMNLDLNQYPNQQKLFMDQLMAHPQSIPLMDGNHYCYQQPPTTGHIPSTTTTTTTTTSTSTSTSTADLFAPIINNNPWPTRFGLE